jgi:hypothetical protein
MFMVAWGVTEDSTGRKSVFHALRPDRLSRLPTRFEIAWFTGQRTEQRGSSQSTPAGYPCAG